MEAESRLAKKGIETTPCSSKSLVTKRQKQLSEVVDSSTEEKMIRSVNFAANYGVITKAEKMRFG